MSTTNRSPHAVPPQWAWHYQQLQDLRDRLLRECGEQSTEAAEPVESHSMDLADSATDEFNHDLALSLLANEQDALYEVEAALQRILNGTYGICEESRQTIAAARLRAVPWTRYTKAVEEQLEQQGQVRRAHLPAVRSIQGAGSGGLAKLEEPESEELLGREVARHQRNEAIKAIESGVEPEKTAPEAP